MATGRPVESEESKALRAGKTIEMWPSIRGAKNWPHAAFNPNTGLLYANTNHGYSTYRFIPLAAYKPGVRYQGIENMNSPITPETLAGHVEAIDPLTGQAKWRKPLHGQMIASAMLATGGGLLFTGKHTGEFMALDADTGETLWEFQHELGRQRPADHVDEERQAVRHRALGAGRLEFRAARPAGHSAGRLGLDLRPARVDEEPAYGACGGVRARRAGDPARAGRRAVRAGEVKQGAAIYAQNCAPCHGPQMRDPDAAFDLRKFPPDQKGRFVQSVTKGKNAMPPWGDLFKEGEIDALWAYVMAGEKQ